MGLNKMISSGVLFLVSAAAGFNVPGGFSSNQRVPNSCATLTGSTCIFPFTYNGASHYQCTSTACIPGSTFPQDCNVCVCDSLGVSVCTTNSCGTCSAVSGPAAGSACIFPFTYGGVTHQSCAEWVYGGEHQGKYWCSTKVDPTGTHVNGEGNYGFCSSECSGAPREFETVSRFRSAASSSPLSSSAVSFGGASASSRGSRPF